MTPNDLDNLTLSVLQGRDKKQRCVGCGKPTPIDRLFYVTPDPVNEPPDFYCSDCKEAMRCVDIFAKRNY